MTQNHPNQTLEEILLVEPTSRSDESRLEDANYEIVETLSGGKSRNTYKVKLNNSDDEEDHIFVAKVKKPADQSEVHAQINNNFRERNVQAMLNGVPGIPRLAYSKDDINVEHYIEGETLSSVKNTLTTRQKNKITERLISTLANIHQSNVTHRDIHPGNIIVDGDTKMPYIVDWEKAKTLDELATGCESISNNPHETMAAARYMLSPVVDGIVNGSFKWDDKVAQRNDVHALAMSILEMYHGSLVMPHSFSSSEDDPNRLVLKRYKSDGSGFEERIDCEINREEYQANVKSALKSVPSRYRSVIKKALLGSSVSDGQQMLKSNKRKGLVNKALYTSAAAGIALASSLYFASPHRDAANHEAVANQIEHLSFSDDEDSLRLKKSFREYIGSSKTVELLGDISNHYISLNNSVIDSGYVYNADEIPSIALDIVSRDTVVDINSRQIPLDLYVNSICSPEELFEAATNYDSHVNGSVSNPGYFDRVEDGRKVPGIRNFLKEKSRAVIDRAILYDSKRMGVDLDLLITKQEDVVKFSLYDLRTRN